MNSKIAVNFLGGFILRRNDVPVPSLNSCYKLLSTSTTSGSYFNYSLFPEHDDLSLSRGAKRELKGNLLGDAGFDSAQPATLA